MLKVCVLTGDPRLPDLTKRGHRYNEEDRATHEAMREALRGPGRFDVEVLDDHSRLLARFAADPPDLVLNFCDTGFRNVATQELHVPALLETLGIPYSGATPACMAICYDKEVVLLIAASLGIPAPEQILLDAREEDRLTLPYPVLIKPNQGDGSVGITKDAVVRTPDAARDYIAWARRTLPGRALLAQEYLPGPEYGVALIGNPGALTALPVLEVDFSGLPDGCNPILSFESKAIPDSPYWTDIRFRPAQCDQALVEAMIARSERLFARLGCRDYARFDFRCAADGEPKLMEVNPNPAWAYDGKLALMAGFAGIAYPQMLEMIVDAALSRERAESSAARCGARTADRLRTPRCRR